MPFPPRLLPVVVLAAAVLALACSSGSDTPDPTVAITVQGPTVVITPPAPSPQSTATAVPATPTAAPVTPTSVPTEDRTQPIGMPLEPSTPLIRVVGEPGGRSLDYTGGTNALQYSLDIQPSDDPDAANAMGWNCRTHVEYEGQPATDWYIAPGTPVYATMDGLASLYVISLPNAFDYYGADREPYLGNPDRARAPLSPFPGPGGGKGVYVEVVNSDFATEYGHLDLPSTLEVVPTDRFTAPYAATFDYEAAFSEMRFFNDETLIATWPVSAGDLIGYSGDSGYSEAPHLHYTVRLVRGAQTLCPTTEPGFENNGWLSR